MLWKATAELGICGSKYGDLEELEMKDLQHQRNLQANDSID